jgi:hypothetical protein
VVETEFPDSEKGFSMSNWRSKANIFGWLSLLCWSAYPISYLASRMFPYGPDWFFGIAIYSLLFGCFPATLFALIAATAKNKWWIALAVLSAIAFAFIQWDSYKHPFYI